MYEEDAAHDAKWARLLDYEQNMQDDQADELTAAIYVRETSLTDDELTRRGLTRSGTKSRRGLLIGREAREDLWTRFKSGAIRAQDAEAICLLTQHIQDKARIDAMQTAAANDLARGNPWNSSLQKSNSWPMPRRTARWFRASSPSGNPLRRTWKRRRNTSPSASRPSTNTSTPSKACAPSPKKAVSSPRKASPQASPPTLPNV
ncbi:hypothetical protein ABFY27_10465 [Akkermansia massiliensis]